MRRSPFQITLTPTEQRKLEQIVRCTTAPAGMVQRARIILRFAAGWIKWTARSAAKVIAWAERKVAAQAAATTSGQAEATAPKEGASKAA